MCSYITDECKLYCPQCPQFHPDMYNFVFDRKEIIPFICDATEHIEYGSPADIFKFMADLSGRSLREFYDVAASAQDEQGTLELLTDILSDLSDQCDLGIHKNAMTPTIKVTAFRPPLLLLLDTTEQVTQDFLRHAKTFSLLIEENPGV